jgi:PAS domain S-box-containing protein
MIPGYAYTPYIWPSFCTVVFLSVLAIYSWQRRSVPGAIPFAIGCLFAAFWAAGAMMEYAALNIETRIFWFKFQSLWRLPTTTASLCFVLEYAWPGRWLTRRNLVLLSIPCMLGIGVALTNDLHRLAWREFVYEEGVIELRGPANWMFLVYGYVLSTANLIVFIWLFIRSPQHRWPVAIMVTGQVLGRGLYLLDSLQVLPLAPHLNVPPVAFEYLLNAIALFGFRILDPIPLARRAAIDQLRSGMLVLDPEGRVVSLNPAAERILAAPPKKIKSKTIRDLIPAYPGGQLAGNGETEIEFSLTAGQEHHFYMMTISALNDWRGQEIGRLLLIRDVTEKKQAQEQILEQQKVLTTLHEREQLARELHDSLGQVLGYISMQAQAVRKRFHEGQMETIEAQLARLAEVAQEAHRDIRESIFSLKNGPVEGWSFFESLQRHLATYQENYGIHTDLVIAEGLTENAFEMDAKVQLLRVIQEALTNSRKHGQANHVQISFTCEEAWVRIVVADEGCGFDPDQITNGGKSHFGLSLMRERMQDIGGNLEIVAQPEAGTRVMLHVPIRDTQKEIV